uniref:Uncharacterized protein n=1 Tax=uncultured prokaryote TaxID=198431 RepID=A0A0H5Q6D8_9ZZZZ|nr:hypothetical protein [uncultured prokaryote]
MKNLNFEGIGTNGTNLVVFFTSDAGLVKRFHSLEVPASALRDGSVPNWLTHVLAMNTAPPWEDDTPFELAL